MKKLTITWKKILGIIFGVLGVGTLTSCYGMPINDFYKTVEGQVFGDTDSNPETPDEPVSNVKVCINDEEVGTTDSEGRFSVYTEGPDGKYKFSLEDVDGDTNGKFKKYIKSLEFPNNQDYIYNHIDIGKITLEKDE